MCYTVLFSCKSEYWLAVVMLLPATFSVIFFFCPMQGTKYNFIVLFQIVGYFAERLISRETLQRNSVMQKSYAGDQVNGTTELT